MKCRYCRATMINKICPNCGYSEQKPVYDHEYEMSKFRSKAAAKIAEIDFPPRGKIKKRK